MSHSYYGKLEKAIFKVKGNQKKSMRTSLMPFDVIKETEKTDFYGEGDLIQNFEKEISDFFGKEKGIFFLSGTMAQQIAMRIYCDEVGLNKIAYHPSCHMEIHEEHGLEKLHNIKSILIGDKDKLFTINDLMSIDETAAVLFEIPQREIGAQAPKWEELIEMIDYCRSEGFYLHLDGARLFEILPYYNKTAKEIADLFDSVYISFYKGLNGIAGAMLLGKADFIEKAKIWRKRYGGTLIRQYPYIVTAKYVFERERFKLEKYWKKAVEFADLIRNIEGIQIMPDLPICNTFHVFFDYEKSFILDVSERILDELGLALFGEIKESYILKSKAELVIGSNYEMIPSDMLKRSVYRFSELLSSYSKK